MFSKLLFPQVIIISYYLLPRALCSRHTGISLSPNMPAMPLPQGLCTCSTSAWPALPQISTQISILPHLFLSRVTCLQGGVTHQPSIPLNVVAKLKKIFFSHTQMYIRLIIVTIFKGRVQGHSVHSQCCAPITTVHLWNLSSIPNWELYLLNTSSPLSTHAALGNLCSTFSSL